jgi:transposase
MPWKTATKIELSEKEIKMLKEYAFGSHSAKHLSERSRIVLEANAGKSNREIMRELGLNEGTVRKWRDRYAVGQVEIKKIMEERPHKLRSVLEEVLSDAPRSGAPVTYQPEEVAGIIAVACEDPSKFGLPFSHWTPVTLRRQAVKMEIVGEQISSRQVGRFLKSAQITATSESLLAES